MDKEGNIKVLIVYAGILHYFNMNPTTGVQVGSKYESNYCTASAVSGFGENNSYMFISAK